MHKQYRNQVKSSRGRCVLIKRLIPFVGLILIYALLVARPLFVASGYSNRSLLENVNKRDNSRLISANMSWLAPDDMDLAILKEHTGDFDIGQSGIYIIDVINIGTESIASPITVTDNLPIGLTPLEVDAQGWDPCELVGQLLTCVYSNTNGLPSASSLPTINLTVTTDDRAAPEVTNFAVVTNDDDDDTGNNIASDPTTIVSADLEVSKSVTPTVVAEGDSINYTISILNNGPSSTSGVVLTDTLPGEVTFITAEPSQGAYNSTSGLWSVGDLTNGEIVTLTLTASVDLGTKGMTIVNLTDGIKSDLYDYDVNNDTASASFRVGSTVLTGLVTDVVTYQPIISANLILTDSVNHVYTTTTTASGWYTFTDTISTPLSAGDVTVKAAKEDYEPSTVASVLLEGVENRVDIELDTTDLFITKKDGRTTVAPGQIFTYTVAITNVGSISASDLIITDVLDTHLSYITDTLGISHTKPTTNTLVWIIDDDLESNEEKSFKVVFEVADALPSQTTEISNTVEVNTSSPEANLTNNVSLDVNTSTGTPNVSITKSVNPSQARTGQSVTYKIKVSNTGSAPVTDVEIIDNFSLYLNLTRVSTTKGTATTNTTTRKVTVDIDVLDPDETVTITVIGRVNTTATYNRFVSNFARLSYLFAGGTTTKNSNTVSFQLIVASTLPGTGGGESVNPDATKGTKLLLPALLSGALLGLLGLFAFAYGYWKRSQHSEWANWYLKMGIFLSLVALIFGLVTIGLSSLSTSESAGTLQHITKVDTTKKVLSLDPVENEPIQIPVLLSDDPDILPDYPIPTPTIWITPSPDEKQLDTSPVEWILIPDLGVDTIVKYVPYDGLTWKIEGLRQEVAWLEDTSWPGLSGNVALAGHVTLRNGGDGPFRYLNQLNDNDLITLYTQENVYTYQVDEKRVVEDTDVSILESGEDATLTLITCTDWDNNIGFYLKRLVVSADLIRVEPMRIEARGN